MKYATLRYFDNFLGERRLREHWTLPIFPMKLWCVAYLYQVSWFSVIFWRFPCIQKAFRMAVLNGEGKGTGSDLKKYCLRPIPEDQMETNALADLFTRYNRPQRSRIGSSLLQYLLLDTVSWHCGGPSNGDGLSIAKWPLPRMNHLVSYSSIIISVWDSLNLPAALCITGTLVESDSYSKGGTWCPPRHIKW